MIYNTILALSVQGDDSVFLDILLHLNLLQRSVYISLCMQYVLVAYLFYST